MTARVHPTAVVADSAHLADGVEIGPHAVIEDGVSIGEGTRVFAGAVIKTGTSLGAGNVVKEHAVLGGDPQHTGYRGEPTYLVIGDRNMIGEGVTIHRAYRAGEATRVGNGCYLMALSHIGHDCAVGDGCVMTNFAALAGHCVMEDRAILGGYAAAHQFCRIGTLAMLGGDAKTARDAVPYMTYLGAPAHPISVNLVGLRRAGISEETRTAIRQAYRILFKSGLEPDQAAVRLREDIPASPERDHIIEFIETTRRGIAF
ncbi:acyl-ACP--UDP-N-acetylglucosamine O-acyltransferase [bacterium]|nr:acyl-ACP--UDP-N-acetylglucosamine O-acyltransferase [bacterium]